MRLELLGAFGAMLAAAVVTPDGTTLVACAAGAYASFSFGDPVTSRSKVFTTFFACIILGWAFAVVSNALIVTFTKIELTVSFRAALGAIMSCISRFWMPSLAEKLRSGAWTTWIPFINKKGD